MQESPLFNRELPSAERLSEESRESGFSQEERERVERLWREANAAGAYELLSASANERTVILRRRLRAENGRIINFLWERINEEVEQRDYYYLYNNLVMLSFAASERDAKPLADLLVHDEIGLNTDRSEKTMILEILERIGTAEAAGQIRSFAAMTMRTPYEGSNADALRRSDQLYALVVLFSIRRRSAAREDLERIDEAYNAIKENLERIDEAPLSVEEEEGLISEVGRDLAFFESLFLLRHEPNLSLDEEEAAYSEELRQEFKERQFYRIESRLDVVRNLYHQAIKEKKIKEPPEKDPEPFMRRHWLEYYEENPPPYAPTLGIEIEVREKALLPPEAEQWNLVDISRFFAEKRKLYQETERMGVPRGGDPFWEFAHKPSQYYLTLSREVHALIALDLIPANYKKHSLHLTIGGVTSRGSAGKEAFVLARALEASGWSTSGGRLLRPYLTQMPAWTYKGKNGIVERNVGDLELGTKKAIEIRTFQVQGLYGLNELLRSAYFLGASLIAYQRRESRMLGRKIMTVMSKEAQLADMWEDFSEQCRAIFRKYGLRDPKDVPWIDPDIEDAEKRSDFVPFARLLDEARKDTKSKGAEFVREMRKLIIKTRAKERRKVLAVDRIK